MVSGTLAPADPAFAAATTGDLRLLPSSPALGAGVALTEAPQDHAGRCYGSPPTVGAFEREP